MFGNKIKQKYGIENPIEMNRKIRKIFSLEAIMEKPTAVPRNGALHGVANKVAKSPVKKLPRYPFFFIELSKELLNLAGSNNSKKPSKFILNKNKRVVIKIRK